MSHFSAALEGYLAEKQLTQMEFGRQGQLSQGTVSSYLRDHQRPDPDTLHRIIASAGDAGPAILVAYLRDLVPANLRHVIEIHTVDGRLSEDPPILAAYESLPPAHRRLLEKVAAKMEAKPKIAALLQSSLDLL